MRSSPGARLSGCPHSPFLPGRSRRRLRDNDRVPPPRLAHRQPAATNIGSASAAAIPSHRQGLRGAAVTLPAAAQRIVSFSPSRGALRHGTSNQVVGVDKSLPQPPGRSWNTKSPHPSPPSPCDPNLVIASRCEQESEAPRFAPSACAASWRNPPTSQACITRMHLLGQLTGHSLAIVILDASMKSRIDAIAARLKGITTGPSVYYEITQDGFTVGPHASSTSRRRRTSRAARPPTSHSCSADIIAANPDVILLTRPAISVGKRLTRPSAPRSGVAAASRST